MIFINYTANKQHTDKQKATTARNITIHRQFTMDTLQTSENKLTRPNAVILRKLECMLEKN